MDSKSHILRLNVTYNYLRIDRRDSVRARKRS